MPLDAINPLMSALGTLGPALWTPPVPDGPGVDQADRQQVVGTYAGLLAEGGEAEDVEFAALFAGGGGLSAGLLLGDQFSVAFSGGGTLQAQPNPALSFGAAFSGGGALAIQPVPAVAFSVAFSGGGSLSAGVDVAAEDSFAALFSGGGGLSAGMDLSLSFSALFSGGGSLSAGLLLADAFSVVFAGGGALTAQARPKVYVGATFAGGGSLSAQPSIGFRVSPLFAGGGSLTVASVGLHVDCAALFGGQGRLRVRMTMHPPWTFRAALRKRLLKVPDLADLHKIYWETTGGPPKYPFLILNRIGRDENFENNTDSYYLERDIQVSVFAADSLQSERLAQAAHDALLTRPGNPPLLFKDGYEMVRLVNRGLDGPTEQAGVGPGGASVWGTHFDVRFLIGKG